jgi:hypothetical protein
LDGISFIDQEVGRPRVNVHKLTALYEEEWRVPVRVKIRESIDDAQLANILAAIRGVLSDTGIVVARVREGCTECTLLVPGTKAAQIASRFADPGAVSNPVEVEETTLPPAGSIARRLFLEGPPIDLGAPDAAERFEQAWRRAVWMELLVRPWRWLRLMVSASSGLHSA